MKMCLPETCCDTQLVQAVEARSKQSKSLIKTWTVGDILLSLASSVCSDVLVDLPLIIMNDTVEQFIPASGASGCTLFLFLSYFIYSSTIKATAHFPSCWVNILWKNYQFMSKMFFFKPRGTNSWNCYFSQLWVETQHLRNTVRCWKKSKQTSRKHIRHYALCFHLSIQWCWQMFRGSTYIFSFLFGFQFC